MILNVAPSTCRRQTVSRYLRRAGFTVWEARTGAEALRRMADDPDLVILGVGLPDMPRRQVVRHMKAQATTATIPILHMTATVEDLAEMMGSLLSGTAAYLIEPIRAIELIRLVRELLGLGGGSAVAARPNSCG